MSWTPQRGVPTLTLIASYFFFACIFFFKCGFDARFQCRSCASVFLFSIRFPFRVAFVCAASRLGSRWWRISAAFASRRIGKSTLPFAGTVTDVGYLGNLSIYQVRLDHGAMMKAMVSNEARTLERAIGVNDRVWLSWAAEAAIVAVRNPLNRVPIAETPLAGVLGEF